MKYVFFFGIVFLLGILEATGIGIPVVLDFIFLYYINTSKPDVFGWGLLGGIILDVVFLKTIGATSIFFMLFLCIVFLYERKFEILTIPFVFLATFLGGLFYMNMMGYYDVFQYALINSLLTVLCFKILTKISNNRYL